MPVVNSLPKWLLPVDRQTANLNATTKQAMVRRFSTQLQKLKYWTLYHKNTGHPLDPAARHPTERRKNDEGMLLEYYIFGCPSHVGFSLIPCRDRRERRAAEY